MNGRPASIDCKTLVSMMHMMQGRGGGSKRLTFLVNKWDSLARLIYVRFLNENYLKLVRTVILIRRRVNII